MSWHYSRALVGAYWGDRSLDGEPCAQSRSTNIAGTCWSPGKTTDALSRSRSGMTYEPLTDDRGEDVLTWCLEGSLVRTSPAQEKGQDLTASGPVFGGKCGEPLAKFDPVTSLLKTPQCLLFAEEQESLQTLPRWGSIVDGELSEHTIPALLTSGTGCGLWVPTPTAGDSKASGSRNTATSKAHAGVSLTDYARADGGKGRSQMRFPTPAARDHKGANSRKHCAVNGTGRKHMDQLANAVAYPDLYFGTKKQEQTGGQLNPDWVEWLQGWIIGMTSTEPLNPDRFRAWQRAFVPGLEDSRQSETDRSQPAQH